MKKSISLLMLMVLTLTGCNQAPTTDQVEVSQDSLLINYANDESYNVLVPMRQSAIRGITNEYASSFLDLDIMEQGLMDISKDFIKPSKSILYQAGQYLSIDDTRQLLGRELTEEQVATQVEKGVEVNNVGLNPSLVDAEKPEESKIYVNTLIEQDYYTLSGDGEEQIDTIAIGFGINPQYTYTVDGKETTMDIDQDELIDYAYPYLANRMTSYIRKNEELADVQIVYGFFVQSDNGTIPGSFNAYTSVGYSETEIGDINTLDRKTILFPSTEGSEQDSELNKQITNLGKSVYKYFLSVSGTYAYGEYTNNDLTELKIYVSAEIYSPVEIDPFVNYLTNEVDNYISVDVPLSIQITKSNGQPLAVIFRQSSGDYQSYIY